MITQRKFLLKQKSKRKQSILIIFLSFFSFVVYLLKVKKVQCPIKLKSWCLLNKSTYIFHSLGYWTPKIMAHHGHVLVQTTHFLLCSPTVEEAGKLLEVSFKQNTIPIHEALSL